MSVSQKTEPQCQHDDEIDFGEIFCALWAGKWLIGAITFGVTVIAVIGALMLPNIYRAEALLAPNDQNGAGALFALASRYGGLASLTGINVGGGAADKTAFGLEILKSRKFIFEFVERHEILVPLMAAKGWDSETGELEIDPGAYNVATGEWVRSVPQANNSVPSRQEAYGAFRGVLSVSQDKQSGFVTVAVEHYSPAIAKQWVDWLVEDINSAIMRQDVTQAEQAIEYLNKQIEVTSIADLQKVFFGLIEEQTKTVMLAKVTDEYLLKTLDPAVVPEKRSKPNRRLIVIIGVMLGVFLGMVAVGISNRRRT